MGQGLMTKDGNQAFYPFKVTNHNLCTVSILHKTLPWLKNFIILFIF